MLHHVFRLVSKRLVHIHFFHIHATHIFCWNNINDSKMNVKHSDHIPKDQGIATASQGTYLMVRSRKLSSRFWRRSRTAKKQKTARKKKCVQETSQLSLFSVSSLVRLTCQARFDSTPRSSAARSGHVLDAGHDSCLCGRSNPMDTLNDPKSVFNTFSGRGEGSGRPYTWRNFRCSCFC